MDNTTAPKLACQSEGVVMIIIGLHDLIYPTRFIYTKDLESLRTLQASSSPFEQIAWFDFHDDSEFALCSYAKVNGIDFAIRVHDVVEFLSGAYFLPRYLLVDSSPKVYQTLADEYLLDSKVLCVIGGSSQIEECALQGIDGVVFAHLLQLES